MSSTIDPTVFDQLDPAMEDGTTEDYPLIAWVYGSRRYLQSGDYSYTGGWFLDAAQAPMDAMPTPWTAWERPLESGLLVPGYATIDLHVAVLRQRRCWFWDTGDQRQMYPYTQFDRCKADAAAQGLSPSGRLQLLVALPNVETPMVLTFKGAGSQAVVGTRDKPGVLTRLNRELILPFKRLLRQQSSAQKSNPVVPRFAFWISLGLEREGDAPRFVQVGSGTRTQILTLPTIHHLDNQTFNTLEDFEPVYVGSECLEKFQTWFQQTEPWARFWDAWEIQTPSPTRLVLPPSSTPQTNEVNPLSSPSQVNGVAPNHQVAHETPPESAPDAYDYEDADIPYDTSDIPF